MTELLLKTRDLLEQAGQTLAPLADELLEARLQRNERIEEQYLIAGIFDQVPRLRLEVRFNRAWANLYLGLVTRENISLRSEALHSGPNEISWICSIPSRARETGFRCRLGLAMTFREQARYEEARRLFEALLNRSTRQYLADTRHVMNWRGARSIAADFDEARVILRPLLEKRSRPIDARRPARAFFTSISPSSGMRIAI